MALKSFQRDERYFRPGIKPDGEIAPANSFVDINVNALFVAQAAGSPMMADRTGQSDEWDVKLVTMGMAGQHQVKPVMAPKMCD